jgi:hypothetical protein
MTQLCCDSYAPTDHKTNGLPLRALLSLDINLPNDGVWNRWIDSHRGQICQDTEPRGTVPLFGGSGNEFAEADQEL